MIKRKRKYNNLKRHKCINCKRVRYENKMVNLRKELKNGAWICKDWKKCQTWANIKNFT